MFDPGLDQTEHLEDEVGCGAGERGIAGGVVGWADLYQPTMLRPRRTEPGIDGFNVEAEIDWGVPQVLPDLLHERHQ